MREIKFRAWDKHTKKMSNNVNVYTDNGIPWWTADIVYANGDTAYTFGDKSGILMQYTGLKDKNGKEIYEGDIVTYDKLDQYYFTGKNYVEYIDGGFYPFADNDDGMPYPDPEKCVVIGNIYENPELIK